MRLLLAVGLIAALAGCQSIRPTPTTTVVRHVTAPCEAPEPSDLERWVEEVERTVALTPEEALAELSSRDERRQSAFDRFRYALLNQRVGESGAWILSRDTLRDLRDSEGLDPALMQLAGALQFYSQAMINNEARRLQLADELEAAQRQQRELAAKIEALTSLEQNISHRKNQEETAPVQGPVPGEARDGS